jgi:hypothetical protein
MKLKHLFIALIAVQLSGCSVTLNDAQIVDLRNCISSDVLRWNNCVGTTIKDGNKYFGEFRNGKFHGRGTMTFNNGDKFVGEFRDGIRQEDGMYISVDGRAPIDASRNTSTPVTVAFAATTVPAQNNLPGCTGSDTSRWSNCVGTTTKDRNKYFGEFRNGKFHGRGTMTFINGDKFVGEFRDGIRQEDGMYISVDGRAPIDGGRTISAPPTVAIAPRQAEPTRSSLNLTVSASSPDTNGVVTLNITTNSDTASLRVNGDEVGGRADGRYSVQRFAQIGNNNFEVIATNRFGNTRIQTISVSRQAADNTFRFASLNPIAVRARPATNAVAIIIGIQDYRRVPKAEYASNDARAFYDYAVRGLGVRPENIKLLLDQEADDVEILGAFRNWLPLKARKGQTDVYVFFSGHGLPSDDGSNLYMLPHGVDKQFLDRTAIKQSELIASLQAVSPRSVTMFMDACYSGQSRTGETLLASARPISIQSKASSYPANFNVISASAPDQLASSSPDLKHGMFSYFLMKGMEGEADENKDGNITMAEMQSYLKEYVGKKAMSLNRTQVPQLNGDQSRVLVSR